MSFLDVSLDWKLLLSCLPEDYEELAVTHKQLQTQYGNAKITTAEQLLRLFFVHVGAELPLRQTVVSVAAAGGPKLAPMRLHMKMRRAVPYLHALVARMCVDREDASPELWSGYDMCALDGSTVSGPGARGTNARLHANIRLSDLRILEAQVTDPAVGETFKNFSFEPGQLVLADRGYSNAPGIAWVREHQADVLVRLNRGALPIFDPEDGQTLDVLAWVRSLPDDTATIAQFSSRPRFTVVTLNTVMQTDARLTFWICSKLPDATGDRILGIVSTQPANSGRSESS